MTIPKKCDECGAETRPVELHVCERGWLCDGCYFSNESWMTPDEYNEDKMENC